MKWFRWPTALIILLFAHSSAGEFSVGVVDVTEAIFATESAKSRLETHKQNPAHQELVAKYERVANDLQRLSDHANANASTWSQKQQTDFREKMDVLRTQLRTTSDQLDGQQYAYRKQIFDELLPIAEEQLRVIVDEQRISVVLKADAVLMGYAIQDLTADLVTRMNATKPPVDSD